MPINLHDDCLLARRRHHIHVVSRAGVLATRRERYPPLLAVIEKSGEHLVHVGARADEEEDDQQKRLEVEEGRLEWGRARC